MFGLLSDAAAWKCLKYSDNQTPLIIYLQLKFFFIHQRFLKVYMFNSNYSVNTNISYGSPVNFLRV